MGNEIATQGKQLPAYLQKYSGVGSEDVNINEVKIPMIKIVQLQSEENANQIAKYGDIINGTTKENYGSKLQFVVVKAFINWVKFSDDKKIIGMSTNGKSWTEGELSGTAIDQDNAYKYKRYNYYVLPIKEGNVPSIPALISFSGTSAKEGQKLYNNIAIDTASKLPIFAKVYSYTVVDGTSDKGKFKEWKMDATPAFAPEAIIKIAAEARHLVDISKTVVEENASGEF